MTGEFHRSLGIELGGSKNDRTALAVVDFFPKTSRLILVGVDPLHGFEEKLSADESLVKTAQEQTAGVKSFTGIGIHGPTTLPPYFKSDERKLPFPAKSRNGEVLWMIRAWEKLKPRPKPFLPYLQRPAEIWLRYFTQEKFPIPEAMGANMAPLAARFHFLAPHLPGAHREVYPRATLTRIVSSLGLSKNITRLYTDVDRGVEFREDFFTALSRKLPQLFIYDKDLETMILQLNCFHAFLAAFTQHLAYIGQTEPRPRGFPKDAAWIEVPRPDPDWSRVFGGG